MIVFLDLETTGLNPRKDEILEVAAIITDDAFTEVQRYQRVLWSMVAKHDGADPEIDPVVTEMHATSGLWKESAARSAAMGYDVRAALCTILGAYEGRHLLAGNTIGFDKSFVDVQWPDVAALLHYRSIDVSSFNEMAKRFWPDVYKGRPTPGKAHRAMADCEESLATARYYTRALGSVLPP